MCKSKELFLVLPLLSLLLACCPLMAGDLEIKKIVFHDAYEGEYNEAGSVDNGGVVFVFIRNKGSQWEGISNIEINDQNIDTLVSNGNVQWYRYWPTAFAPGDYSCLTIKARGWPCQENSNIKIEIWSDSGDYVSANQNLIHQSLRIDSIVPSSDYKHLYIYLRNDDTQGRNYRVDYVYADGPVTNQCSFMGTNVIYPGCVGIVKVNYTSALPVLDHLCVLVGTRRSDGQNIWIGAPTRLSEPKFHIGTWGGTFDHNTSGPSFFTNNMCGTLRNGENCEDTNYWLNERHNVRSMPSEVGNWDYITRNEGNPAVYAWAVADEPEGDTSSYQIWEDNERCWWGDSTHPTHLNLHKARSFNEFGHIPDIVSMDHYAMFSAPNIIPNTWVFRKAQMKEAFKYSECLKLNTEPKLMWAWSQLKSGWNTQPLDWGVDMQFWMHVAAGAKSVMWFTYQQYDENSYQEQINQAVRCGMRASRIKNLLYYSGVQANVARSTSNVRTRMLVGEDAVVIIVINENYSCDGWAFSPYYNLNSQSGWVRATIPSWIPIEMVKENTLNHVVDPLNGYSINGRDVTLNFNLYDEAAVFIIGRNDTQSPENITRGNKMIRDGKTILSWDEPFDNYGVHGYWVCKYPSYEYVMGSYGHGCVINSSDSNQQYIVIPHDFTYNSNAGFVID